MIRILGNCQILAHSDRQAITTAGKGDSLEELWCRLKFYIKRSHIIAIKCFRAPRSSYHTLLCFLKNIFIYPIEFGWYLAPKIPKYQKIINVWSYIFYVWPLNFLTAQTFSLNFSNYHGIPFSIWLSIYLGPTSYKDEHNTILHLG